MKGSVKLAPFVLSTCTFKKKGNVNVNMNMNVIVNVEILRYRFSYRRFGFYALDSPPPA